MKTVGDMMDELSKYDRGQTLKASVYHDRSAGLSPGDTDMLSGREQHEIEYVTEHDGTVLIEVDPW